jgi:hypothetical protein
MKSKIKKQNNRKWSINPETGRTIIDVDAVSKNYSLFMGVPTTGRIACEFVNSLANTIDYLAKKGIDNYLCLLKGCSVIDLARNMIVAEFLASGRTHLLFIDDDVAWDASSITAMLAMDLPVVGGSYSKKGLDDMAHVECENPRYEFAGCIEAAFLPTGFMMIRKEVFEKIISVKPELKFNGALDRPEINKYCYRFFQSTIDENTKDWLGEDYFFCNLAREVGYTVALDKKPNLQHVGTKIYYPTTAKRKVPIKN